MKNFTNVWIVRTSEDGNIGVYSSYKKARERVTKYLNGDDAIAYTYGSKAKGWELLETEEDITINIERFYLNM